MSESVEAAMDRLLGNPTTCPHGNPIPGSNYVEPPRSALSRRRRPPFTVSRIPEELEFTPDLLDTSRHRRPSRAPRHGHRGLTRRHADGRDRRHHVGVGAFASARILVRFESAAADHARCRRRPRRHDRCGCATEVDPADGRRDRRDDHRVRRQGSTAELLDQLLVEAGTLSEAIVQNEGQH